MEINLNYKKSTKEMIGSGTQSQRPLHPKKVPLIPLGCPHQRRLILEIGNISKLPLQQFPISRTKLYIAFFSDGECPNTAS